jgi:hypothetical protein
MLSTYSSRFLIGGLPIYNPSPTDWFPSVDPASLLGMIKPHLYEPALPKQMENFRGVSTSINVGLDTLTGFRFSLSKYFKVLKSVTVPLPFRTAPNAGSKNVSGDMSLGTARTPKIRFSVRKQRISYGNHNRIYHPWSTGLIDKTFEEYTPGDSLEGHAGVAGYTSIDRNFMGPTLNHPYTGYHYPVDERQLPGFYKIPMCFTMTNARLPFPKSRIADALGYFSPNDRSESGPPENATWGYTSGGSYQPYALWKPAPTTVAANGKAAPAQLIAGVVGYDCGTYWHPYGDRYTTSYPTTWPPVAQYAFPRSSGEGQAPSGEHWPALDGSTTEGNGVLRRTLPRPNRQYVVITRQFDAHNGVAIQTGNTSVSHSYRYRVPDDGWTPEFVDRLETEPPFMVALPTNLMAREDLVSRVDFQN